MPVVDKLNKEEVKRYNEFVEGYERTNIMQGEKWALIKSNWLQEMVYLEKDSKIVAAITILIRKFSKMGISFMYAPRGPIGDMYDIDTINSLIKEIEPVRKKYNAFVLRFDPEVKRNQELENLYKRNKYRVRNDGYDMTSMVQTRYNMVMDLRQKDEEQLLKDFSSSTRRNIRIAIKNDVRTTYGITEEYLKIFYELHEVTGKRDNFMIRPYEYYKNLIDTYSIENIRIYITEHEGNKLSAAIALKFGNKVWYMAGASSNIKRDLKPNYVMQLEMIKWALDSKCEFYDLGGVYRPDESDGVYGFKRGFCTIDGCTEYIGEIDKIYNKSLYYIFENILPMFKKIRSKIRHINTNKR